MKSIDEIAEEIVPREEFDSLAQNPENNTAYVGYEPSGELHLGHMVTANAMIRLQEMGFNTKILIADLHAELNKKGSAESMRDTGSVMERQLRRFGLSDETEFIYGSEFQFTQEYQRMMHRLAQSTTSNRAERSMADISHGESVSVSHLMYPVMQATDIWYLDADVAVGGMEQRKVHMLARDVFPTQDIPKPTFVHTPLISDLDGTGGKMSSSTGTSVSSADTPDELQSKIESAYCPTDSEDDNPVLQMFEYHVFPRNDSVTVERPEKYGDDITYVNYDSLRDDLLDGTLHPSDAKSTLAEELNRHLRPVRDG